MKKFLTTHDGHGHWPITIGHFGHLRFPMDTSLARFDPEAILLLQSKFWLKSTKGFGKDVENMKKCRNVAAILGSRSAQF